MKEEANESFDVSKAPKVLLGGSVDPTTGPEPASVICSLEKS